MGDSYAFKVNKKYIKKKISEIEKITADDNYTYFHFSETKIYHESKCLKHFEKHPFFITDFVRINRHEMVREKEVIEFSVEHGVLMENGKVYDLSNEYVKELLHRNGKGRAFSQSKKKSTQKK